MVGVNIAIDGQYAWSITDDGVAKVSAVADYPTQGRAGGGVIDMRLPVDSQELAAAAVGRLDDNIVVLTDKDKPKYMRVGLAPQVKRGRAGGDFVISMRAKERVIGVVTYQRRIEAPEPVPESE